MLYLKDFEINKWKIMTIVLKVFQSISSYILVAEVLIIIVFVTFNLLGKSQQICVEGYK